MRLHSALLVVFLTILVVGSAVSAADTRRASPTSLDTPDSVDGAVASQSAADETTANGTTIRITPQPDGDARWNVSMEFVTKTENETAAFEKLGDDFENGRANVGPSQELFIRIADQMESETRREMKILDVELKYTSGNTTHTLSLSFVWTNFAQVEGDKIVLRDAFLVDDGSSTWLGSLTADQRLVIDSPNGYRIQNSPNYGHSNGTITLEGPKSLNPENGEIDVTYSKTGTGNEEPFLSTTNIVLLLLVVSSGVVGLYVLMQRRDNEPADDSPADDPPATVSEPGRDSVGEVAPGSEPEDNEPSVELLSDEERVERLLKRNGGRMKQAKIVAETNWSNAKVSQLLSSMDNEGRVDKLRIGRENLITLPDEDIADFDSE
ncbi:helix-turn-helix transcriptional regulator [Haladaptatus pallidirubidus]|uniref:IclR helix-turn-helix domain-containing protein n=1 Tax=Haladaptatus pallidirubidus TaxID=1008152 RepID=A0AAV3UGB6_9EURY|nr:hypothetical protein [Haladaptatus pallidirubidus]